MRYSKIDFIRGLSVLGMILFHANYLLVNSFGINNMNFSEAFWYVLGKGVAITFILISGISLYLFSRNRERASIEMFARKRFLLLALVASIISFVTYFFFYEERIFFGIIHFFAIASLIFPYFLRFRGYNLLLGAAIILIGYYLGTLRIDTYLLSPLGLYSSRFFSADYYPIFPWFGYFLLGMGGGYWLEKKNFFDTIFSGKIKWSGVVEWIGKNSLAVYIFHVPILYGLCYILF